MTVPQFTVACSKCGKPMLFDQAQLDYLASEGVALNQVSHEECPEDEDQQPEISYRAEIVVTKQVGDGEPEVIGRAASENIIGTSFKEVVPKITGQINDRWSKIVQFAPTAD